MTGERKEGVIIVVILGMSVNEDSRIWDGGTDVKRPVSISARGRDGTG